VNTTINTLRPDRFKYLKYTVQRVLKARGYNMKKKITASPFFDTISEDFKLKK
jgi:hypothetical protein